MNRLRSVAAHLRPRRALAPAQAASEDELPLISWAEIQRHQMPQDAWVVINGTVYGARLCVLRIQASGS